MKVNMEGTTVKDRVFCKPILNTSHKITGTQDDERGLF